MAEPRRPWATGSMRGKDEEEAMPMLSSARDVRTKTNDGKSTGLDDRTFAKILCGLVILIVMLLSLIFWVIFPKSSGHRLPAPSSCDTISHGYQCQPDISHLWGQYSPYYAVSSEISLKAPPDCKIPFVQILSRHGARDPTDKKSQLYAQTIALIQKTARHFEGDFAFLEKFQYNLGADQLTDFGRQEMVNSGIDLFSRYQDLAEITTPFIRASGEDRVIESARKFSAGFHRAKIASGATNDASYPYPVVVISEETGSNNTLEHGLCTAFEASHAGKTALELFGSKFLPPITARISNSLGTKISDQATLILMDLCPFTTVADPLGVPTPFCKLFTADEWAQYDYFQTLGKYYGYGPGNSLGPTQGVGYVNELIARLTSEKVVDHTCVNHTLDADPDTFPLGRGIYADFGHDNGMTSVYAALGLYDSMPVLDRTEVMDPEEMDHYSAAQTVPFGGRIVVEKMVCAAAEEELVRVVMNGRVLPLNTCGGDEMGRCRLSAFVGALGFAKSGGRWSECFGDVDDER